MTEQTARPPRRLMPEYIDADTYAGRWYRPQGKFLTDTYTAGELAELGITVMWKSFGHVNGVEMFGRDRFLADSEGNLHVYAQDGHKVIVHPFQRRLRILTSPAQ